MVYFLIWMFCRGEWCAEGARCRCAGAAARCTKDQNEGSRAPRQAHALHKRAKRKVQSPALSSRGAQKSQKEGSEPRAKLARCTKDEMKGLERRAKLARCTKEPKESSRSPRQARAVHKRAKRKCHSPAPSQLAVQKNNTQDK